MTVTPEEIQEAVTKFQQELNIVSEKFVPATERPKRLSEYEVRTPVGDFHLEFYYDKDDRYGNQQTSELCAFWCDNWIINGIAYDVRMTLEYQPYWTGANQEDRAFRWWGRSATARRHDGKSYTEKAYSHIFQMSSQIAAQIVSTNPEAIFAGRIETEKQRVNRNKDEINRLLAQITKLSNENIGLDHSINVNKREYAKIVEDMQLREAASLADGLKNNL